MGDDSIVGKVLSDRYEVMAELGRGQLGIVYKARHILMDRLVAVKVMAENIRNNSEAFLRFQRITRLRAHEIGLQQDRLVRSRGRIRNDLDRPIGHDRLSPLGCSDTRKTA